MIDWQPIEKLGYREDRFLIFGEKYGCCFAEFRDEVLTFFYNYRWFKFEKQDGFTYFAELTPPKTKMSKQMADPKTCYFCGGSAAFPILKETIDYRRTEQTQGINWQPIEELKIGFFGHALLYWQRRNIVCIGYIDGSDTTTIDVVCFDSGLPLSLNLEINEFTFFFPLTPSKNELANYRP